MYIHLNESGLRCNGDLYHRTYCIHYNNIIPSLIYNIVCYVEETNHPYNMVHIINHNEISLSVIIVCIKKLMKHKIFFSAKSFIFHKNQLEYGSNLDLHKNKLKYVSNLGLYKNIEKITI
jgi:hypothetical protein